VEAHGGELNARSNPSGGTRVSVRIPLKIPTLLAPSQQGLPSGPMTKGDNLHSD
jgi:hypothetical protein